jgi:EF hand domain-containing protein
VTLVLRQAGLCLALLALLAAAGCSRSHTDSPPHRAIFSPNGEPLSGGPLGFAKCETAMGGWFDRLEGAHKGALDRATFLADARHQFKAMDLNGDGILTPEVLLRYREPYSTGVAPQQAARDNASESDKAGHPGHMKKPGSGRTGTGSADIARDVPDPVMSADTSLRLQVTEPEFLRHAEKVFDSLDANHDGELSRAEALEWCGVTAPPESSGGFLGIF